MFVHRDDQHALAETATDPRTHGPTDPRTHGPTDLRTHGPTDPRTHGPTDPRTYGPTDLRTHGPTDPPRRAIVFYGGFRWSSDLRGCQQLWRWWYSRGPPQPRRR